MVKAMKGAHAGQLPINRAKERGTKTGMLQVMKGVHKAPKEAMPIKGVAHDSKNYIDTIMTELREQCKASMVASADVFGANIKLFSKVMEIQTELKAIALNHKSGMGKKNK